MRERLGVRFERREGGLVGTDARLASLVLHQRERLIERARAPFELDLELGGDLVEERVPRVRGRRVALGEHLLFGLCARVRREPARAREVVRVRREQLVGNQRLGAGLVELDPLEIEEAQIVDEPGEGELDLGVEIALTLAADLDREPERRVVREAGDPVVEHAERIERGAQLSGVELGDPAAIAITECPRRLLQLGNRSAGGVIVEKQRREIPVDARARVFGQLRHHRGV